ncbi:hypothetical protein AWB75_03039 [Caballeronia catudaia]|uniref:Uncharacterized protein n=1 Tax=Caballeronia catudaia TaxID=1777136 RepID=A0A158B6J4_9BURK|nr:hypothetical protein [Caballeronia catudaia]SAK65619.1 hypothetical protein AWB75_03039 [Caballeronia catudaia]
MLRATKRFLLALKVILLIALAYQIYAWCKPVSEIVLRLGEPYEQVRQRSGPVLPDREAAWRSLATVIAKVRFDDPVYGFVTPPSVFLGMTFDGPENSDIASVYLSPQREPLPLDEAMAIVAQLQGQFRRGGWQPFQYSGMRPIEDKPELRRALRECNFPMSVWNGGEKYQVALSIGCAAIPQQPGKERYLVKLEFMRPFWTDRPGE